jgi:hypothetical protein
VSFAARVLVLSAIAYGSIAIGFLVEPTGMAARVEISFDGATADNDVRAVYGGLGAGLAIFFLASVRRPGWHAPALSLMALTLGAMALARVVSLVFAGPPQPIAYLLQAVEIGGFLLATTALRRLPAQDGQAEG